MKSQNLPGTSENLVQGFAVSFVKYSVIGLIKHFLYWPLWWYSGGLFSALKGTGRRIVNTWKGLGLGVWLNNIFRPMYGQYDFASRLISFFMRLVQIIFRMVIMVVLTIFFIILFLFYLVLPPLTVWMLITRITLI